METVAQSVPVCHDWLAELAQTPNLKVGQHYALYHAITAGEGRLSQVLGPNYFDRHFADRSEWNAFRLTVCFQGLPDESTLRQELSVMKAQADLHLQNYHQYNLTLLRA